MKQALEVERTFVSSGLHSAFGAVVGIESMLQMYLPEHRLFCRKTEDTFIVEDHNLGLNLFEVKQEISSFEGFAYRLRLISNLLPATRPQYVLTIKAPKKAVTVAGVTSDVAFEMERNVPIRVSKLLTKVSVAALRKIRYTFVTGWEVDCLTFQDGSLRFIAQIEQSQGSALEIPSCIVFEVTGNKRYNQYNLAHKGWPLE